MLQDKKKKHKKFRADNRFWARVLLIVLVASMLAGTFYYVLFFAIPYRVAASEPDPANPMIRVALVYGTSVKICNVKFLQPVTARAIWKSLLTEPYRFPPGTVHNDRCDCNRFFRYHG